jgi:hypothetical protein
VAIGNASLGLRVPMIPLRRVWLIDGILKLCAGLVVLAGSPAWHAVAR